MGLKGFLQWFTGDKAKQKQPTVQQAPAQAPPVQTQRTQTVPPAGSTQQTPVQPIPQSIPQPLQGTQPAQQGVAQQQSQQTQLDQTQATGKKKLGFAVILFILINSIIGSSLFYLPSLGVRSSGAASIIAWVVLFILAAVVMLYIGELITLHPTSGGTYEFSKHAYGRFGSFITGWLIWIAGNFGMALNMVAAAEYFIPETTFAAFVLRAMFVVIWVVVLSYMAYRGIDAGATMLLVFGIIATIVVSAMILPSFIDVPGLFSGQFSVPFDFTKFLPFFQHEGLSILAYLGVSLFFISEAFLGFEAVSYMANEAKEPRKLHRVLITAIVLCGVIMVVYIFASLGTVAYSDYVSDARPFAVQALNTMGQQGQDFIVFGMYLVIVGAAAAWPITGSRLLQAMARDKLFIKQLAVLHPKHKSPYRAVIFQALMVTVFSYLIFHGYISQWGDPYGTVYLIYVLLSLLVMSLILITVPILRKKEASLERPFKAPFGKIGPIIIVILFLVLIGNWIFVSGSTATTILKLAGSFIFLGIPFYFMVEMFYNPESIVKVNEKLSFLVVIGEKLFFPFSIRNRILKTLGDVKGKVILEYGCAVGGLTRRLAPLVGEQGKIYATDISSGKVKIVNKRLQNLPHVEAYHHPHLDDFKLRLPRKADKVISVGTLSYMQHPAQILGNLAMQVKKGGEIIFVDFDKFFYIIPNVGWIKNDEQLKQVFAQAGFNVEVTRKRSVLWQYIYIKGVKV